MLQKMRFGPYDLIITVNVVYEPPSKQARTANLEICVGLLPGTSKKKVALGLVFLPRHVLIFLREGDEVEVFPCLRSEVAKRCQKQVQMKMEGQKAGQGKAVSDKSDGAFPCGHETSVSNMFHCALRASVAV